MKKAISKKIKAKSTTRGRKKPVVAGRERPARSASAPTSEVLINSALYLFSRKGYAATSVKEIADHAGANISLVSYYFNGKEGLYRTCMERFGGVRLAAAERILRPPQSADEFRIRLRMFLDEFYALHFADPYGSRMVQRDVELDMNIAEDTFHNTFGKIFEILISFFREAQTQGIIRDTIDPQVLPGFFMGSATHFIRTAPLLKRFYDISFEEPEIQNAISEQLMHLFCDALLVPPNT